MQHNLSQLLHEQTKDLIWMINPDFDLVYANPAYLNLMKEVTGKEKKLHETVFVEGFGAGYITKWKNYYKRAMLGEHFEIEEHFYHPETNTIEYSAVAFQPLYGDTEEIVAVACQSRSITQSTHQRLAANQLVDASLDVFCTINEAGNFVYVSAAAETLWGYRPDELIGKPYIGLTLEEDIPKTNEIAGAIESGQEITTFYNRYKKKGGGIAYNLWSARWDGTAKLMYCVARDGKEKIKQEELIQQSEKRFKALVQEGSDLIGILDSEGNYTYVSPTSTSILGMPPEKFIGRSPFDFIHPDDIEATQASLQKIATESKVVVPPFRFQNSQNAWRWIETVLTNMIDNPAVNGIVANSRDITEKIEEEQKLKLFEKVINSTTDSILITEAKLLDKPGPKIVYVNDAFCRSTGYSAEEVIGENPRFLQGAKSDKEKLKTLGEKLRKGEASEITVVNYTKHGDEFWVNFAVSPVVNEQGKVTHFISVQRDVTEQKEKELEEDFKNEIIRIFHQSNDYSLAKCLTMVCKHIATYGDFNFAEIWLPTIDGKRINLVSNHTTGSEGSVFYKTSKKIESFAFGEALPGYVWKHKTTEVWSDKDKEWHSFKRKAAAKKAGIKLMIGVPLKHNGEVIGVLLMGTIKAKSVLSSSSLLFQKLESIIGAELSRKKTEIELAQIFDFTPEMICVAGFDGHLKKVNPAGLELLGYSLEEMRSRPILSFIHEDDRLKTREKQKEVYKGGKIQAFENRYITKQGQVLWLSWSATAAPERNIIYSVAKNITEEKNLRELNRQAGKLAKIGSWEVDLLTQSVYWSNMVHKIHETDPETFVPNLESGINFYKKEFQKDVQGYIQESANTGEPFDFEAIIVTANNKERWVRVVANAEMHMGECTRIFGSIQDITSQREAEHEKNYLQTTLENSLNEIYIFDSKTFRFNYVNKGALRNLGYTEQEIKALTPLDLKPEYVSTSFKQLVAPLVNNEKEKIIFFTNHKRKDGTLYPVEVHLQLVKSTHNNRFLAIILDITERKEAEQVILQANERFEKVTEATNDAIWDWDIKNKTFYRSKAIEDFFGKDTSKSISHKDFWKDAFHPDDLPNTRESLNEALSNPSCKRWEAEYRVIDDKEEVQYVLDRGVIVRDKEGKAIRMIGAMTNITDQKDYEKQLKELNRELQKHAIELERSNEELEQFAFVTSHDLQEPLRMITSFMDQLKRKYEDQLDEKALQYIHFATDGAKRMKQIILDLLEYSRANRPSDQVEEVNLNEVLFEYKQLRRKAITESSVSIISKELPTLITYKAVITQIFHCLIDNAIKYVEKGVAPIVEIKTVEKENEWEFSIADNGIGVDPEFFDKIFAIFQRLHNRDTYEGTGIGLAIAKRSVEFLGGQIWLTSAVGEGTTFYFTVSKNRLNNL